MRRLLIVVTLLCSLSLLVSTASASAASPWWHLTSGSRPGHLHAGAARSEVQEISVAPVEVEPGFELAAFELKVGGVGVGFFANEPYAPIFGVPAPTRKNVQSALEGVYGAGNVEVVGSEAGTAPLALIVKSIGKDADRKVEPVEVNFGVGIGTGGAHVLTTARPDGQIYVTAANLGDASHEWRSHCHRHGPRRLGSGQRAWLVGGRHGRSGYGQ